MKVIIHPNHSITFEREKKSEYLYFRVSPDFLTTLPTGYRLSKKWNDPTCLDCMAVRWWFLLVFDIGFFIKNLWWNLARFFYRKQLIKRKKKGSPYHWFWPIYFLSNWENEK